MIDWAVMVKKTKKLKTLIFILALKLMRYVFFCREIKVLLVAFHRSWCQTLVSFQSFWGLVCLLKM